MQGTRQRRIGGEIEKVIAEFLNKNVANLFPAVIVSVVRTEISADLKNMNIYVSIFDLSNNKNEDKIFQTVLNKATQARHEVASKCQLKFTPLLNFIHDTGYAAEDSINKKIIELKKSEK